MPRSLAARDQIYREYRKIVSDKNRGIIENSNTCAETCGETATEHKSLPTTNRFYGWLGERERMCGSRETHKDGNTHTHTQAKHKGTVVKKFKKREKPLYTEL